MNNDELKVLRHSAQHILEQAICNLYPDVLMAMGPATDTGFYGDFEFKEGQSISADDFPKIEEEIKRLIKKNLSFKRKVVSPAEAREIFKDNPYKLDWVDLIEKRGEDVSLYYTMEGDKEIFVDLCAGPHIDSTSEIKALKLLSTAGAYWHGNSDNKMLTRIYGTAFTSKEDLKEYLHRIEEAKKRDHRKLGKELDLFSIDEYVGSGLIMWHPNLSVVREEIESYWRHEHRRRGYKYVYTPVIGQSNLWETSGHLDHFADAMYPAMKMDQKDKEEKTTYYVKPMNCPFHVRIYKSSMKSYKDLPIRYCELGNVYRFESSGSLHGMLRVRGFTQDDAHIICREDQFIHEVNQILDFALSMNKTFGFDKLNVYLSVRDPENKEQKYIKNEPVWQLAEHTLEKVLQDRKIDYQKDVGGAKFYGPAIDLKAVDSMGREWQGTTIQLDMNLPQKFGMSYIGEDGQEHTPIMLHRTLLGSMERFVGTLIEQYAGAFPVWLAPVQVKVLPISEKHLDYAHKIQDALLAEDIRTETDDRNNTINYQIREAHKMKIPYSIIVGDKEIETNTISIRDRKKKMINNIPLSEFMDKIKKVINSKSLELWED